MSELSIDSRFPNFDPKYVRLAVYGLATLVSANILMASCGKPNTSGGGSTHTGGKYTGRGGFGGSKNTNSGGWKSFLPATLPDSWVNSGQIPGYANDEGAAHAGRLPDKLVGDPEDPFGQTRIMIGGTAVFLSNNVVGAQDAPTPPAEFPRQLAAA